MADELDEAAQQSFQAMGFQFLGMAGDIYEPRRGRLLFLEPQLVHQPLRATRSISRPWRWPRDVALGHHCRQRTGATRRTNRAGISTGPLEIPPWPARSENRRHHR